MNHDDAKKIEANLCVVIPKLKVRFDLLSFDVLIHFKLI